MRTASWTLTALLAPAALIAAPDAQQRVEISVLTGASLLEAHKDAAGSPSPSGYRVDRRTSTSGSVLLGFRAGYFMSRRAALEAGLVVAPGQSLRYRDTFACPPDRPCPSPAESLRADRAAAYHYDVAVLYELSGKGVRPFLTAGVGGVTYGRSDRTSSSLAWVAGAGVKVDAGRVALRLDATDHLVHDHFLTSKTEHDVHLDVGVTVRP